MTLTKKDFELLDDFCNDNDYRLTTTYSGRGMFGSQCIGIISSDSGIKIMGKFAMFLVANLEPEEEDDLFDFPDFFATMTESSRQDNMGMDMIYYFPHMKYIETEEEDEEDE